MTHALFYAAGLVAVLVAIGCAIEAIRTATPDPNRRRYPLAQFGLCVVTVAVISAAIAIDVTLILS